MKYDSVAVTKQPWNVYEFALISLNKIIAVVNKPLRGINMII
jgi:hypothetical protein